MIQELETQTSTLKNDLSDARLRMRHLQIQVDEYKARAAKQSGHKHIESMNVPSLPNLSPQSSTISMADSRYYNDGNQSDATTHTAKSSRVTSLTRHIRADSQMTSRTAYSEGDAKSQLDREKSPTPPPPDDELSEDWQKYIEHLEV